MDGELSHFYLPPRQSADPTCLPSYAAYREGGLDTFGNVGNLRLAAHHTAPQRLTGQMTGANNPFGQRQDQQQQHFNQSASGNLVDF